MRSFWPQPHTATPSERGRAVAGALIGLLLTSAVSHLALGPHAAAYLIAPMGASAVLLFCLPASPLAQPWSIIGGNFISALIGVTCAKAIANPMLAAPLAVCLAIGAMFYLRCLHPPGGAVALTAALGEPAVHAAGYHFALWPVGLNSLLLALAALLFNNLTGRRYPHAQQSAMQNTHATRDPVPLARIGFKKEDLDAALARYGQVLAVSRDDLEAIIFETEIQAYGRRFGVITCGEIMSRDVVTVETKTPLNEAWRLLRKHRVHALPVLNRARRVVGMVGQGDFLHHAGLDEYKTFGERLRSIAGLVFGAEKPAKVGDIMASRVITVFAHEPIAELVPLMSNSGLHHIPVVDNDGVFAGIVSQSDLLAALYESRLAEAA
ncbi:HPP family protein [Massilia horti]|uniref:HPP family protein n=1 Tax=Massilia horti TaxID=2562153 RepID=A0A4Y9T411_9BURK|nr:HPP family protein [Massilia horti]